MLKLRTEQVAALADERGAEFAGRMLTHLCRCFPAATRTMSDRDIHAAIRHGRDRAVSYGITTERGVCKYLNLMFVFGRDFDRDPGCAWAGEILGGARIHRGLSTIALLYQEAQRHDPQARGRGGNDERPAL